MSSQSNTELERLEGFEILPSPPGAEATTLELVVRSGRFACVADRRKLLELANAVRRHFGEEQRPETLARPS